MIEQVPKSAKENNSSKKVYQKPTITSEPLCSDMALCTCDPDAYKSEWPCGDEAFGLRLGPT